MFACALAFFFFFWSNHHCNEVGTLGRTQRKTQFTLTKVWRHFSLDRHTTSIWEPSPSRLILEALKVEFLCIPAWCATSFAQVCGVRGRLFHVIMPHTLSGLLAGQCSIHALWLWRRTAWTRTERGLIFSFWNKSLKYALLGLPQM